MDVKAFAAQIKALGFRVFIAERGDYGCITDAAGERVVTFDINGSLSGQYGPPSRESGTGWQLDVHAYQLVTVTDVQGALAKQPPAFCGKGWKRVSTLADYLAAYQASSKFAEV